MAKSHYKIHKNERIEKKKKKTKPTSFSPISTTAAETSTATAVTQKEETEKVNEEDDEKEEKDSTVKLNLRLCVFFFLPFHLRKKSEADSESVKWFKEKRGKKLS